MTAPAGYYELNALAPWIVGAGCVLLCLRCRLEAHAPIPRRDPAGYTRTCEAFLEEHRRCADVRRGAA